MQRILITVGNKVPTWIEAGWQDYRARFPKSHTIDLIEIPLAARTQNVSTARAIEARAIEKVCSRYPGAHIIALDVLGKSLDTDTWAAHWQTWHDHSIPVIWIIGGPDGLEPALLARCHARWSLSALTFPHALVRLLWIEQCYRAYTIQTGHPYHRA